MSEMLDLLTLAFEFALIASMISLPVVLFVFCVDFVLGSRLPAKFRGLLWCVVVVRLLVPPDTISPVSVFSVQQAWYTVEVAFSHEASDDDGVADLTKNSLQPYAYRTPDGQELTLHANPDTVGYDTFTYEGEDGQQRTVQLDKETGEAVPLEQAMIDAATVPATATANGYALADLRLGLDYPLESLAVVWLLVAVGLLLRACVGSIRFALRVGACKESDDQELIDKLLRACDRLRVGLRPRLKLVPDISSPLVFGFWRPTLCLPLEQLSELSPSQLELIMLHELAHVRRRDALLAWLLTFVRAIHWFNPLAWWTTAKIARYSEQACDQLVVQTRPEQRREYADILIQFASRKPTPQLGFIGLWFSGQRTQMEARVTRVMQLPEASSMRRSLVAIGLLATVAFAGLSEPDLDVRSTQADTADVKTWSLLGSPLVSPVTMQLGTQQAEVIEKQYDIAEADAAIQRHAASTAPDETRDEAPEIWLALVLAHLGQAPAQEPGGAAVTPARLRYGMSADHWDLDGNTLTLRTSQTGHAGFATQLRSIEQSGFWQVSMQVRVITMPNALASTLGIDWDQAAHTELDPRQVAMHGAVVRAPRSNRELMSPSEVGSGIQVRAETTTCGFSPHLANTIDTQTTARLISLVQNHTRVNVMQAPTVTTVSGQMLEMCDESLRPFVVGIKPIRGNTVQGAGVVAQQPQIAVLPEGQRIRIRSLVRPHGSLGLVCEITESRILDVDTLQLPGGKIDEDGMIVEWVQLQSASAKNRTVSVACSISEGESLLVASPNKGPEGEDMLTMYLMTPMWMPL